VIIVLWISCSRSDVRISPSPIIRFSKNFKTSFSPYTRAIFYPNHLSLLPLVSPHAAIRAVINAHGRLSVSHDLQIAPTGSPYTLVNLLEKVTDGPPLPDMCPLQPRKLSVVRRESTKTNPISRHSTQHFRRHVGGETEKLDLMTHSRTHVTYESLNVFVVDAEGGVFVETRERLV
jgi:hypothetical protein